MIAGTADRIRQLHLRKECMRSDTEHRRKRRVTAGRDSFKRTRYYKPPAEGTNFVLLDADVAMVFRDPETVNQVLRSLMGLADQLGWNPLRLEGKPITDAPRAPAAQQAKIKLHTAATRPQ